MIRLVTPEGTTLYAFIFHEECATDSPYSHITSTFIYDDLQLAKKDGTGDFALENGDAFCSRKDQYNRSRGIQIALGRAMKRLGYKVRVSKQKYTIVSTDHRVYKHYSTLYTLTKRPPYNPYTKLVVKLEHIENKISKYKQQRMNILRSFIKQAKEAYPSTSSQARTPLLIAVAELETEAEEKDEELSSATV